MDFKTQAAAFLTQIQNSKRNPAKPSTIAAYQSRLNSHILPVLGEKPLSTIENGTLKTFVAELSNQGLSPATIRTMVSLVKAVVSSAVDANGNEMYPRTWNAEFIDSPVVNPRTQKAPVATPQAIQQALARAKGQEKALYALLAGSGLRIGEALALMVGPDDGVNSFWIPESGTVEIRTTVDVLTGKILSSPKTDAGIRQVDLAPNLNAFLCQLLLDEKLPRQGQLFPIPFSTLRDHAAKSGIERRFHAYRRFRVTYLRKAGVPEGLIQFWAGHAGETTTDRYDKIRTDVEARKEWAAKIGLGFQLEAR